MSPATSLTVKEVMVGAEGGGGGVQLMEKVSLSFGAKVIKAPPPLELVMVTPETGLVTVRVVWVPSGSTSTSVLDIEPEPLNPKGFMLQEAEEQEEASTAIRAVSAGSETFVTTTSSYMLPLEVVPPTRKVTVAPGAI